MTKFFAALLFMLALPAHAACTGSGTSWNCTAGSSVSEVQSAINSASDGATIAFAAGNYSWGNGITLSNAKGVTLRGAGSAATIVNVTGAPVISMSDLSGNNTKPYRITGFRFQNAPSNLIIWFYGAGTMSNVRIDNNVFANFATGAIAIFFGATNTLGKFYGVIDHNTFSGTNNFMSLKYLGPGNPSNWASALRGTSQNVFVEDNTYNFSNASDLGSGCVDVWGAGAVVFRRNNVTNCLVTAHGVSHGTTVNFELYGNTLKRTAGSGYWEDGTRAFHHQGSGEIFAWGNSFVHSGSIGGALAITHYRSASPGAAGYSSGMGQCNGSQSIDGNRSGGLGYPCWMQPGRAPSGGAPGYGVLSPVYAWMNVDSSTGNKVSVSIENPWNAASPSVNDHIKADRDYYDAVSASAQSSPTTPFNGTTGMGFGTLANRPTTCSTNSAESGGGVGYFAVDQGSQGVLYRCSATNNWSVHYTPYTYPHPLVGGGTVPAPPPGLSAPTNLTVQ
jgi:hypothetical protein